MWGGITAWMEIEKEFTSKAGTERESERKASSA